MSKQGIPALKHFGCFKLFTSINTWMTPIKGTCVFSTRTWMTPLIKHLFGVKCLEARTKHTKKNVFPRRLYRRLLLPYHTLHHWLHEFMLTNFQSLINSSLSTLPFIFWLKPLIAIKRRTIEIAIPFLLETFFPPLSLYVVYKGLIEKYLPRWSSQ